jgi:hypothetical protein
MPERERASPVTGFSFTNQPPCYLTSHARYPAVESSDNAIVRAVATRLGKTRPPIAPPQTFVARVSETLRPLSVHRQVSATKRRRRAVRLSEWLGNPGAVDLQEQQTSSDTARASALMKLSDELGSRNQEVLR